MSNPTAQPTTVLLDNAPSPSAANQTSLRTIARNTAAMLIGQVLIKIISFLFSVYVVRRLGAADFGRYSAAMAYAFIFAMLTELGTSAFSVREMARKPANISSMVPDIMALRALLSLVVIGGITLSAWLLGKTPDMVLGVFIASIGLLLYAFQGPLDSLMIAQERLYFSAAFNVLNQVVFISLGTIALMSGAGYIGLLLASLAGVFAMGLASAYVVRRVLRLHFVRPDPRRWRPLLRASFPFGVIGVVSEFSRRFDTVFMSFVLPYTVVGWYSIPYNLVLMMLLLAQSLALSMFPTMVKEYDSGRGSIQNTVQRALRYLLLLSLPVAIGGMVLADRIITLLYGSNLVNAIPVMQIMVWALPLMFLAELLGRTSITMHREKKAASFIIVNAIVTLSLDVILIPQFGAIGAAIVMVISQFINVLLSVIIIGPAVLFKGNLQGLGRVAAAGALMGMAVWLLRDATFVGALEGKVALLLLITGGAVVYGLASFWLKAISPGEARYLYGAVRYRLRRGMRKSPGDETQPAEVH